MKKYYGYQYFDWKLRDVTPRFSESDKHFEREKRIEAKYINATSETKLSVLDDVAMYKELAEVESGCRQLKDVMRCGQSIIRSKRESKHIFL